MRLQKDGLAISKQNYSKGQNTSLSLGSWNTRSSLGTLTLCLKTRKGCVAKKD